jgi:hypothetical protein
MALYSCPTPAPARSNVMLGALGTEPMVARLLIRDLHMGGGNVPGRGEALERYKGRSIGEQLLATGGSFERQAGLANAPPEPTSVSNRRLH